MPKANNIASTAHSQHAEMASLLGQKVTPGTPVDVNAELQDAYQSLQADFDALKESNAKLVEAHEAAGDELNALTEQLAAEKTAHEATQAALDAATKTQDEPPAEENK